MLYKTFSHYIYTNVYCFIYFFLLIHHMLIYMVQASSQGAKVKAVPQIVKGELTNIAQHPYLAAIVSPLMRSAFILQETELVCSGSIITSRVVLTAAHCLLHDRNIGVIVGANNLMTSEYIYRVQVTNPHPLFNENDGINDIGLIRLACQIVFQDFIQPIALNMHPNLHFEYGLAVGYGQRETGSMNGIERGFICQGLFKDVTHLCFTYSIELNFTYHIGKQFCALKYHVNGPKLGHGDSGGPYIHTNKGILTQVGVISGTFHNPPNDVFFFTNVSCHRDWILSFCGGLHLDLLIN